MAVQKIVSLDAPSGGVALSELLAQEVKRWHWQH